MLLLILKILMALVFLICLGFIAYWIMVWIKGDCRLRVWKGKMTPVRVEEMDVNHVLVSFTIPIVNTGKQIGTIMDAFVRTYLPFEQYDKVNVEAILTDNDVPRNDGYWQAFIMERKRPKLFLIKIKLTGKSGHILRDLEDFPDMPMDIIYQVVARSDYYYDKTRVILTKDDLQSALYQYTMEVKK